MKFLGGKTPLEYASTPNLDKLASVGTTGIMDVHGAGIPVGTDLGHMILFGYGLEDYPGRGPIEAFLVEKLNCKQEMLLSDQTLQL